MLTITVAWLDMHSEGAEKATWQVLCYKCARQRLLLICVVSCRARQYDAMHLPR